MKQLISDFTQHLSEAIAISLPFTVDNKNDFKNVIITGLGGSGIGGKIVSNIVAEHLNIPVVCNNDYALPAFADKNTLLIASSYSGNTEETLEALAEGLKKSCTCAIVTSGGTIKAIAKEKGLAHIVIPGGLPPRAAFGYSFVQLFKLLNAFGVVEKDYTDDLDAAIELLNEEEENIIAKAKEVAAKLHKNHCMIYSSFPMEGVAVRFRQQLNENSKILACHHIIPEMNHNELVGWAGGSADYAVVNFMYSGNHFKTNERFRISKEIIGKYTQNIIDLHAKGQNLLEESLFFIHLGDWISYELSVLRNVDAIEVDVITHLKGELSKL